MVRESIDSGGQPARPTVATVRTVAETLAVGDEEVEAVVIGSMSCELCQIRCREVVSGDEIGDQGTA